MPFVLNFHVLHIAQTCYIRYTYYIHQQLILYFDLHKLLVIALPMLSEKVCFGRGLCHLIGLSSMFDIRFWRLKQNLNDWLRYTDRKVKSKCPHVWHSAKTELLKLLFNNYLLFLHAPNLLSNRERDMMQKGSRHSK